jgi:hypothetical protein
MRQSQTAKKALSIKKKKGWGLQVWLRTHRTKMGIARMRQALSEPLPETRAHQEAPLTRVTTWVSPWGELLHSNYKIMPYKDARATKEEWLKAHQEWRERLPKTQ